MTVVSPHHAQAVILFRNVYNVQRARQQQALLTTDIAKALARNVQAMGIRLDPASLKPTTAAEENPPPPPAAAASSQDGMTAAAAGDNTATAGNATASPAPAKSSGAVAVATASWGMLPAVLLMLLL